jgi:hypothetical protein
VGKNAFLKQNSSFFNKMRLLHATGCHSRYIVTASELSTMDIQLPEIQRELCEEHVEEIMAHPRLLYWLVVLWVPTINLLSGLGPVTTLPFMESAPMANSAASRTTNELLRAAQLMLGMWLSRVSLAQSLAKWVLSNTFNFLSSRPHWAPGLRNR